MIAEHQVRGIIQGHVPGKQWMPSEEILAIVESHRKLDSEDRASEPPGPNTPRWKILVREVLVNRVEAGRTRSTSSHPRDWPLTFQAYTFYPCRS